MKQNSMLKGAGGDWKITCLYPFGKSAKTDRNSASMAFLYESKGFFGLFTGDLSAEQEQELVGKQQIPKIDVLKASHHGSKYGTCEELLREAMPESAVISCGLNNGYGHPGLETLERLRDADVTVYETRFLGQIRITREGICPGWTVQYIPLK